MMKYTDNINEYALEYLYDMFNKYAPTSTLKEVLGTNDAIDENIIVHTRESRRWFDALIYLKRRSEALEKLVKILEIDEQDDFAYFPAGKERKDEYFIFGMPASKEDFDFIKKVLFHEGESEA